jgi:hypothetical protein
MRMKPNRILTDTTRPVKPHFFGWHAPLD